MTTVSFSSPQFGIVGCHEEERVAVREYRYWIVLRDLEFYIFQ